MIRALISIVLRKKIVTLSMKYCIDYSWMTNCLTGIARFAREIIERKPCDVEIAKIRVGRIR